MSGWGNSTSSDGWGSAEKRGWGETGNGNGVQASANSTPAPSANNQLVPLTPNGFYDDGPYGFIPEPTIYTKDKLGLSEVTMRFVQFGNDRRFFSRENQVIRVGSDEANDYVFADINSKFCELLYVEKQNHLTLKLFSSKISVYHIPKNGDQREGRKLHKPEDQESKVVTLNFGDTLVIKHPTKVEVRYMLELVMVRREHRLSEQDLIRLMLAEDARSAKLQMELQDLEMEDAVRAASQMDEDSMDVGVESERTAKMRRILYEKEQELEELEKKYAKIDEAKRKAVHGEFLHRVSRQQQHHYKLERLHEKERLAGTLADVALEDISSEEEDDLEEEDEGRSAAANGRIRGLSEGSHKSTTSQMADIKAEQYWGGVEANIHSDEVEMIGVRSGEEVDAELRAEAAASLGVSADQYATPNLEAAAATPAMYDEEEGSETPFDGAISSKQEFDDDEL